MTNDFKMIVFKQLTISIKTQHDNKINVSCNANQQNVTHVKHDHQYRRNFKSLNIIWCIVCFFCIYWDAWSFFLSRNTSSVLHSMLNAKHFEIVYVLHHLYIMHLRIECILLKFHWGMTALTEVHFQWSAVALHVKNVVRSTLSYPNETSKECIQFL